ncbi:hypothetical protein NIES4074_26460 [Cylindrospermum sp. NIES-4074]|nr:hypothetical protein NIES4074_26460 [Cylindrospermum sp. NIES-4074]
MSKSGIKTSAAAWQPTSQAASKSIFTSRPFPEIVQREQETAGNGETAAQPVKKRGIIENINRSMSKNFIPEVSNVGIVGVQAKLTIGEPGDQYEQEADRVAAEVVQKMNEPSAPRITAPPRVDGFDKTMQRKPVIPIVASRESPGVEMPLMRKNGLTASHVPDVQADFERQLNQARGGGGALDAAFRAKIEPAMGADFSGVRVHTDSRADQMSQSIQAKAFTTGQDVFFRQGAYEPGSRGGQELIAHELTHVVQQTGTIQPSIQRYHTKHPNYRTSDDGQMAVRQESSIGGQTAFATPALIKDASDKLKAATSVIELEPGSIPAKLDDLDGKEHDVVDVVPTNTQNKTKDMNMELWADCGRSAQTVSGMDQGTGQGNAAEPGAKYNKDGKTKTVTGTDWMEIQKVKMFMDLFNKKSSWWEVWKPTYQSKLDIATINKKLGEYDTVKKMYLVEADTTKKDNLGKQMARLASEMDVLARAEYDKLSPDAKDDFDKKVGINMYADPNIGEAFHISTGGNEHPGKPANVGTWNFHWAGVVTKSGSDTMTLENYSVSDYEEENKDWVFQMYGVGKKGQSFHEEHKDVHKQHGDAPTSMVAVRRKSQEE